MRVRVLFLTSGIRAVLSCNLISPAHPLPTPPSVLSRKQEHRLSLLIPPPAQTSSSSSEAASSPHSSPHYCGMSEGQSQRSVASSVQHRQEAEVPATEERERAAAETAATAARAARLTMAELTAARAEVEAAATADAARATTAELEALRASSTGSSVSADDDRDNELKLVREAAREQAAHWAAAHPKGTVAAALTGADVRRSCPQRRQQPRQARTHRRLG
jgi:hypothetical protein